MDDFDSALAVEEDLPQDSPSPAEAQTKPLDYAPLQQYYGYDLPTEQEKSQMQFVWEYFAEEGRGPGETLATLRDMERSLAKPELGQSRLDRLYSYIRLVRAADDTNAELRAYLR